MIYFFPAGYCWDHYDEGRGPGLAEITLSQLRRPKQPAERPGTVRLSARHLSCGRCDLLVTTRTSYFVSESVNWIYCRLRLNNMQTNVIIGLHNDHHHDVSRATISTLHAGPEEYFRTIEVGTKSPTLQICISGVVGWPRPSSLLLLVGPLTSRRASRSAKKSLCLAMQFVWSLRQRLQQSQLYSTE